MMLARTCRATGSRFRDVYFVNVFEFFCSMRSEHTRESGRKASANHHVHIAFTSMLIKRQKRPNIGEVVGGAHDMNAPPNKLFSNMRLRSCRPRQYNDVHVERIIECTAVDRCPIAKTVRNHFNAVASFVAKNNLVVIGRNKLTSKTRANRANTQNSDASHVSRDQVRRVRAIHLIGVGQHPIRGAERRRRQAPPCRWQPWPVGSFSSWG